jgi:hypothetical protein
VESAAVRLKPDRGQVEAINMAHTPENGLSAMSKSFESSLPSDIRLLLRADAEQCWLYSEVIPVLRDVERPGELPEEEVGAALAYLEAMWSEATSRARETDAAHSHLHLSDEQSEVLAGPASRYHAAVRVLREIVADRITPFVQPKLAFEDYRSHGNSGLRLTDNRPDGCTPRAA